MAEKARRAGAITRREVRVFFFASHCRVFLCVEARLYTCETVLGSLQSMRRSLLPPLLDSGRAKRPHIGTRIWLQRLGPVSDGHVLSLNNCPAAEQMTDLQTGIVGRKSRKQSRYRLPKIRNNGFSARDLRPDDTFKMKNINPEINKPEENYL